MSLLKVFQGMEENCCGTETCGHVQTSSSLNLRRRDARPKGSQVGWMCRVPPGLKLDPGRLQTLHVAAGNTAMAGTFGGRLGATRCACA